MISIKGLEKMPSLLDRLYNDENGCDVDTTFSLLNEVDGYCDIDDHDKVEINSIIRTLFSYDTKWQFTRALGKVFKELINDKASKRTVAATIILSSMVDDNKFPVQYVHVCHHLGLSVKLEINLIHDVQEPVAVIEGNNEDIFEFHKRWEEAM